MPLLFALCGGLIGYGIIKVRDQRAAQQKRQREREHDRLDPQSAQRRESWRAMAAQSNQHSAD